MVFPSAGGVSLAPPTVRSRHSIYSSCFLNSFNSFNHSFKSNTSLSFISFISTHKFYLLKSLWNSATASSKDQNETNKMAALTKLVFLLTYLSFAQDFVFCSEYGESGQEITLKPKIKGKPEEILWKHNSNMILEYDESEMVEYGSFKGRVVLDFETGQLTIRNVNTQDSGQYQSEILINGKIQYSGHNLTVLDRLPEPRVTCEVDDTSDVKTLLCSVESQTQLSYEWNGPNVINHHGAKLPLDEDGVNVDSVYTCTVKNQVKSTSTDFTLTHCHAGRSRAVVLAPVLTITILVIAFLLILLALYFIRRKKEKSRRSVLHKTDTEIGEDHNLLTNLSADVLPGSSDATLPCHTRLTSPKESITVRNWAQIQIHQDSTSENVDETDGETHVKENQEQDLTRPERCETDNHAHILSDKEIIYHTGQCQTKNKERELDKDVDSPHTPEAEEMIIIKPNETDREMTDRSSQSHDECSDVNVQESVFDRVETKKQILEEKKEKDEESPDHQEQNTEAVTSDNDDNDEEQTEEEIKDENHEEQRAEEESHEGETQSSVLEEYLDTRAPDFSHELLPDKTSPDLHNVTSSVPSNNDSTSSDRDDNGNTKKEREEEKLQKLEMWEDQNGVTNEELRGQDQQTSEEQNHVPITSEFINETNTEKQNEHQTEPYSTINLDLNMRDDEQEQKQINDVQKMMQSEKETDVQSEIIEDVGNDEEHLAQKDKDDDDDDNGQGLKTSEQDTKEKQYTPEMTESNSSKRLEETGEESTDPENTNHSLVPESENTDRDSCLVEETGENDPVEMRQQDSFLLETQKSK